jgi:hypothetical protein
VPDVPFEDAGFAFAAEPVVLFETGFSDYEHGDHHAGDVGAEDVADDLVPPAFGEDWDEVFEGELYGIVR